MGKEMSLSFNFFCCCIGASTNLWAESLPELARASIIRPFALPRWEQATLIYTFVFHEPTACTNRAMQAPWYLWIETSDLPTAG